MAIYYESSLKHHGVKGMKWGVRKARPSTRVSTGRTSGVSSNNQSYTRQPVARTTTPRPKSTTKPKTYDESQTTAKSWVSRHKGLVIGMSVAGVAAGAIVARRLMRNRAKTKLSDFVNGAKNRFSMRQFGKNFKVSTPGSGAASTFRNMANLLPRRF